jgi:hypothetical protein
MKAALLVVLIAACNRAERASPPPAAPDAAVTAPADTAEDRLQIAVDRRVELISILFRLAGNPVWSQGTGSYARDVDAHFGPFKNHPAVAATVQLRSVHSISYNAPAELAMYLDDGFHTIRPLSPIPADLDRRWATVDVEPWLELVRAFAADADLDGFLAAHADYHRRAEATLRDYLRDKPVLSWFDAVLGEKPTASYHAVPGLLLNGWNFGMITHRPDGGDDVNVILSREALQDDGAYTPGDDTFQLIAHELGHGYINPLLTAGWDRLASLAGQLHARHRDKLKKAGYDDPLYMTRESVVRAVTLLYLKDRSHPDHARIAAGKDVALGFTWVPDLARAFHAIRAEHGGALPADAVVDATVQVFTAR